MVIYFIVRYFTFKSAQMYEKYLNDSLCITNFLPNAKDTGLFNIVQCAET